LFVFCIWYTKINSMKLLILEDDLETLSVLMGRLYEIEQEDQSFDFSVSVFSEYTEVQDYVNKIENPDFDIILLDRDCNVGGSFHILDFKKFNKSKIISISTFPEWNDEAVKRGAVKVCWKGHENIQDWGDRVKEMILSTAKNI